MSKVNNAKQQALEDIAQECPIVLSESQLIDDKTEQVYIDEDKFVETSFFKGILKKFKKKKKK